MIYRLLPPKPMPAGPAYIDIGTPSYEDDEIVDQLYTGRTPQTVQNWRGFPLVDIEARLVGTCGKVDVQDFVWGGLGDIIISERLLRILQEEGITGIDARSVTITNVEIGTVEQMDEPGYRPPKLHRLVAKGFIQRAPQHILPPTPNYPVVLDLDTWDGSDVLVVWGGWLLTFVSERFVECLQRHSVRNYRVVQGTEFTFENRRYIAFHSAV